MGITGLIRLYWQVGIRFLLSGIEMVVMNYIISMRKLVRKERYTLSLDLKNHILPQDEYEAKWYNWCDGFNQAAELVLGIENDDKNHSDR